MKALERGICVILAGVLCTSSVFAGTDTAKEVKEKDVHKSDFKKPSWLKEVSITVKESYDSNVYLNNNQSNHSNVGSWITSVMPKVVFNIVPLIELDKGDETVKTFDVSYSPEIVTYHDAQEEDYIAHRLAADFKGKVDDFSYGLNNAFTYIDGRRDTPIYDNNQVSAYSSAAPRERRDQFQDRLKGYLRYDIGDFFLRPTASLLYYDLHTKEAVVAGLGRLNYPDRYDVNGGLDLGYKVTKDYSVYLGFRYGHQEQGVVPVVSDVHYSSDYQRLLAGIEGKPLSWLKIDFAVGPDFRNYGHGFQSTFLNANKTTLYLEGSATAEITSKDAILAKAKEWQWVSSTGRSTYMDRNYEIAYRRKITDQLTSTSGARYLDSDYDSPTNVDDVMYGLFTGLTYVLDEHWTFGLDYAYNRGQNDVDNAISPGRECDEQVVSMSVKWSL